MTNQKLKKVTYITDILSRYNNVKVDKNFLSKLDVL